MDNSPYYDKNNAGAGQGPYMDDGDIVECDVDPQENNQGGREFARNKAQYQYGPQNSNNPFAGNVNPQGKKINRYYAKMKPYYVKESD
jgi:hypothetical protein